MIIIIIIISGGFTGLFRTLCGVFHDLVQSVEALVY